MFSARKILPLLAVSLLISACSNPGPARAAGKLRPDEKRKPAPEFSLKDADGKTVRLSDYKGKVVLLNFWATWCGPCKIEMPWFMEFERKYKDQGFAVIGVSMDEEGWEVVKPFIAEIGVNYRVLQGDNDIAALYGGVEALPTTFLVDRGGNVAWMHAGLESKDVFEDGIKELLAGKSSAIAPAERTLVARTR